jgi:tetratricopeptide (TPR) repeat protein
VIVAMATIVENTIDFFMGGSIPREERLARLEDAHRVLEAAHHDEGLGYCWWSLAGEKWVSLHAAETVVACERGLEHFRRAGMYRRTDDLLWWVRSAYVFGPTPRAEAIERVRALQAEAGDSIQLQAGAATTLARLLAMQGDFDEARELYAFGIDFYRSAGMDVSAAGAHMHGAWIEERAGDLGAMEALLRSGADQLKALGHQAFLSTVVVYLAGCLYRQGRFDEARELWTIGRETSPADDVINFVYADAQEGCVLAHEGRHEEAGVLLGDAVDRCRHTDYYFLRAGLALYQAEALSLAGEVAAASRSAVLGLGFLDEKGDVAGAARARERLDDLGIAYD